MIRPNGQPPENLAAMALARSPAVGRPMPARPRPPGRSGPSERRMPPTCLEGRDHVLTPGGSEAAGGTEVASGTSGAGPSIGPAPGRPAVVPGGSAGPGSGSGRGPTVSEPKAAPTGPPPDAGLADTDPGVGAVLAGRGADSRLGTTVGGAGAVPAAPGRRPGLGAVPADPGSRSGAGSAADAAAGCPGLGPVTGVAASEAGSPVSRAAPAWSRRVNRAATARNRARPAPAPPRGPPPAGLPGSRSWPGAAAGAGERIASKSGAPSPASGGNSVMCRPRRETRARARPDRRPGPRR